jgi:hypothetical protein
VDKIIIIIEAEEVLIEEGAEEIIRINIREIKEILMRVINKGIQIFNKEEDNNNLEIRIRLVKHILHNLILFRFTIRTNNRISIKEISMDFRIILINNNFNNHFSNNSKVSNTSNILISTPKINILITKIISSNNNFRILEINTKIIRIKIKDIRKKKCPIIRTKNKHSKKKVNYTRLKKLKKRKNIIELYFEFFFFKEFNYK